MSFAEVARKLRDERLSLEEVARRTGCGGTCTACLPDLRAFLARD
jgi:bacterioferritin-associated ferredoxin